MPTTTASMLWSNAAPNRFAVNRFTKEGTAVGRKYTISINGQWADLDKFVELILTGSSGQGYRLQDFVGAVPNFSEEAKSILVPSGVLAYARTPKLESTGEGDKANLIIPFEEGLQEGTGGAGGTPIGPNLDDEDAFDATNAGNNIVPADSSYRLVFEPDDVELGYGLPFRAGYKWDLTIQAPNLSSFTFPNPPGYDNSSGSNAVATHPSDLLSGLGYDPTNISILAVCNIWREGAITEQQRGALFCYLNEGGGAPTNEGMQAYVLRILRGQTSYRYFLPHVSVIRRYRSPPVVPGFFPLPGEIAAGGTAGAPPPWTNAPANMFAPGATQIPYVYWSTGPQVDMVGDQWQAEVQWQGFADIDTNMYQNPNISDSNIN